MHLPENILSLLISYKYNVPSEKEAAITGKGSKNLMDVTIIL